jgi:hypothetical protein
MSATYVDTFNNDTVPPAGVGYQSVSLTADAVAVWPYNASGVGFFVAKINDITSTQVVTLTMPPATQVSNGEDSLWRNIGLFDVNLLKSDGSALATVPPSTAVYIYVADNTTDPGVWGVVNYGSAPSAINAGALAGYGLAAAGAKINAVIPVISSAGSYTITAINQASMLNCVGGAAGSVSLTAAATLGPGFFCYLKNSSSATVTITPLIGTIDGAAAFQVQPGESLTIIGNGADFFTEGYGRSIAYQFTQQVISLTAPDLGYTLSSAQASAKLLKFTGTSGSTVTIGLPSIAGIYYVINDTSALPIALKFTTGSVDPTTGVITGGGAVASLAASSTTSLTCDGTNIYTASVSSVLTNALISLLDGTSGAPSLNFSSEMSTGLYRGGLGEMGVAVLGASVGVFDSTGWDGGLGPFATGVTQATGDNTTSVATDAFVQREAFNIALALAVALG